MTDQLSSQTVQRGGANAALSVLGLSVQQLSGFVITLLAAGFLSAADYGTYTLAIVFVEFVVMLTYTGFFDFIVTSEVEDEEVLPTMFWVMLGIGIIGGALMVLCAGPLAAFFDVPELKPVLQLFGLLQPFASGISWGSAHLMRAKLMRRYFLILITANTFALFAGALVLVLWQSLYALVLYRATRLAFSLVLFGFAVPELPRLRFNISLFKHSWRYAIGLYGARSLTFFSTFGTDLMLAYLFTTTESGLYRFANRLAMSTVDIIAQPLRSFSLKSFGAAAREGRDLTPVFTMFLPGTLFLVGGFALTVFVLGGGMIEALFRPEYLLALGAVQALSIRAFARVGQNMIEPTFAATKRTEMAFYNNLLVSCMTLAVIVAVAPFGFVTLSWALAGVQVASVPLSLWFVAQRSPINVWPGFHIALRGSLILLCYASALWGFWLALGSFDLDATLQLAFGFTVAVLFGGCATVLAIFGGVLELRIFADE